MKSGSPVIIDILEDESSPNAHSIVICGYDSKAGEFLARVRHRLDALGSPRLTATFVGYLTVGVDQDSYLFGYRNPAPAAGQPPVVGFDIDVLHRVAQAIFGDPNRIHYQLISQAHLKPPGSLIYVPVNFESEQLAERLVANGFRADEPAFFSWLVSTSGLR